MLSARLRNTRTSTCAHLREAHGTTWEPIARPVRPTGVDDEQLDQLLEDYWLAWVTSQAVDVPPEVDERIIATLRSFPLEPAQRRLQSRAPRETSPDAPN